MTSDHVRANDQYGRIVSLNQAELLASSLFRRLYQWPFPRASDEWGGKHPHIWNTEKLHLYIYIFCLSWICFFNLHTWTEFNRCEIWEPIHRRKIDSLCPVESMIEPLMVCTKHCYDNVTFFLNYLFRRCERCKEYIYDLYKH